MKIDLLEIDKGLHIRPEEISEIIEILPDSPYEEAHVGHTVIVLRNGNKYISPQSPLELFQNWADTVEGTGFDLYEVYQEKKK